MATKIKMPKLSQTTEEVRLIRWLVKEGDTLNKGDPLCEVENDKTTLEVESFTGGTVLRLYGTEEEMIAAGTVIAVLGEPGETYQEPGPPERSGAGEAAVKAPASEAEVAPHRGSLKHGVRATPLVRNIALKKNIDLNLLAGTGPRGIITKKDLEDFLNGAGTGAPVEAGPAVTELALSGNQLLIAGNITAGKTRIPHYYLKTTVFMERMIQWREQNRTQDGARVSYNSPLIYACAQALRLFPKLNASFKENRILLNRNINIGLAVSWGEELYVPVIHDADKKEVREIDREVRCLIARARKGKLESADLAGATFTVTNLGMYPVDEFYAIINPPQVAILAVGRIRKVLDIGESNTMAIRSLCTLTGSFDHRAVNGTEGAAFLARGAGVSPSLWRNAP